MVSWQYAFSKGVVMWLWSLVWGIIGGVVALIISGGSILALMPNITYNSTGYAPGAISMMALGPIMAGVFIGTLIASIGGYATVVKIVLESAQELESPRQPT